MVLINIFKESLIIKLIINIFKAFMAAYDDSKLKKIVYYINICFKGSRTYSILSQYINKSPYYQKSMVYKMIMVIAGVFDKLFGIINKIISGLLNGSVFSSKIYSAIKADVNKKLYGFGLLFMSIPIGSIIALILLGDVSFMNMIICWGIFVTGFLLVVIASCESAIKSSVLVKAVAVFFDLIR